jgi:hypothetical protein
MNKLLLAAVAAAALVLPSAGNAAIIADLGLDPTSGTGAFSHNLTGVTTPFNDDYTFQLDHTLTLTIASAINNFANASTDFITNFSGSVYAGAPPAPGGGLVLGPAVAQLGCLGTPQCQFLSGQATLSAGSYFLEISGTGGGTSGYGGTLSTVAVPSPLAGGGIPGILAGCFALWGLAKRRRQKLTGSLPV